MSAYYSEQDHWLKSPREAFLAWLMSDDFARLKSGQRRPMQESSIKVYRSMFNKFITQTLPANDHRLSRQLTELSAQDIERFLDSNNLVKGIRDRYIRLLNRTYEHLVELGLTNNNPAEFLLPSEPKQPTVDYDPPTWLTEEQQQAVLRSLPEGDGMKSRRNRTLLTVLLGGGLRTAEVLAIRQKDIGQRLEDGRLVLNVPRVGAGREHETHLIPFAADVLEAWVRYLERFRAFENLEGDLLFPSDTDWKSPIHPATLYRLTASVMKQAGIPQEVIKRRGARTLRNTFAMANLEAGTQSDELGEFLGHRSDISTRYYTTRKPSK